MGAGKEFNPSLQGFPGKGETTMLFGVDIAVAAGEIAGGENVEKHISFTWNKADGAGSGYHGFFSPDRELDGEAMASAIWMA
jgi:hypothetical protein